MKRLLLILMTGTLIPMTSALAVKVTSLYQAECKVVSQLPEERAQAVKEGLLQVLIKVSGDPEIENNPEIQANLKRADYYVQEYSYSSPTMASSRYHVHISYNLDDVNRLLQKAGVPYWGENRPLILVWLAVANPVQRASEIIGNETQGDLLRMMEQQGKKYGLPLIFPMMDVADVSQVTPADVTAMALPVLKEAGKRYAPDAFLIGKVQQDKVQQDKALYQSQWALVLDKDRWNWTISGQSIENIINTVLKQASQTLAKRYVVKTTTLSQLRVKMEVSSITQRNDLVQLIAYLKQLTPVQQVELLQVSGDVVELSVQVGGSLAAFQQHVLIGKHVVFKSQDAEGQLIYEWVH